MRVILALPLLALAACAPTAPTADLALQEPAATAAPEPALYPGETPAMRERINRWADHYDVPRSLVHRVVQRESDYRAGARNGPYWGLMQILPATARSMNFSGAPSRLLDPDVALKYSIRYLRGAWMIADGDERAAVMHYARGYWHAAKRRGMLTRSGIDGKLWDRVDAGAPLPPLDARGNALPVPPPCDERTGIALALGGPRCEA
ncbi:lytic transglycosylase domain-containing protein [Jannaschia sp. Os4]|uniref:transglycosylase SLT domain-containing protein n=1 Tax=Jannaschia sp. Os4 TaxID=2807617 RepID=UPI00193A4694|nr:lytic transglycosylase domain-containing protein [Jannaschia sp. Os4]